MVETEAETEGELIVTVRIYRSRSIIAPALISGICTLVNASKHRVETTGTGLW